MINRDLYLEELKRHAWNGNVKVITGIRRCGKSTLLFNLYKNYLISKGIKSSNIIEIKLDNMEDFNLRNPFHLYKKVMSILNQNPQEKFYLFIDEFQMAISKKDKASGVTATIYDILNGFRNNERLDVYVTGSNSKMLSKDIATEFRGRSSQIRVHPFSFSEFYEFTGGDEKKVLEEYMITGGMPGIINEETQEDKKNYLINLYSEIYIKDIVERNKIQKEDLLNDILDYLASQISSLTNVTRISNAISSIKKEKVTHEIVANYINHLMDSFLISKARRYDIKGKAYFDYPDKYYYEDTGLRNARLNFRQIDPGHLMENIVYNELIKRGYSVDVGAVSVRKGNNSNYEEIDFVVNKLDKKIYIQSAFQIQGNEEEKNEIKPLTLTEDFFTKILIRNDLISNYYDEKGIYHCKLTDFLLNKIDILK